MLTALLLVFSGMIVNQQESHITRAPFLANNWREENKRKAGAARSRDRTLWVSQSLEECQIICRSGLEWTFPCLGPPLDLVSTSFLTQWELAGSFIWMDTVCVGLSAYACVHPWRRAHMRAPDTRCPSPPIVFFPSLNYWPPLLPMLRLIDLLSVHPGFTSRTVHQVTRQTLVKCGGPQTFSLWDAMFISSTAIFHRKIKGAEVTTF